MENPSARRKSPSFDELSVRGLSEGAVPGCVRKGRRAGQCAPYRPCVNAPGF